MTVKRVKCREHDGWFKVVVKPGRPPVRCMEDNKCDAVTETISKLAKATGLKESQIVIADRKTARAPAPVTTAERKRNSAAVRGAVIDSEPRSPRNRSVP